jgi:hypothetical protein
MVFSAWIALGVAAALPCFAEPPIAEPLPKPVSEVIERISPDSLKGHLSFLASDLLEGRNTPSRGLDIAAEYIASQFRRAGLTPLKDGSYFQTANWKYRQIPVEKLSVTVNLGGETFFFDHARLTLRSAEGKRIDNSPLHKARVDDLSFWKQMPDGALEGKAVLVKVPSFRDRQSRGNWMRAVQEFNPLFQRLKPSIVLGVAPSDEGTGVAGQLIDPAYAGRTPMSRFPSFSYMLHSRRLADLVEALPDGDAPGSLKLEIPDAVERPVALRNVIGTLPGSDPILKDTYIIVTAHYDHLGQGAPVDGDAVFNGANDDASGTASVVELAAAFRSLPEPPKRTIVFMTVFGEEKGLLGTQYYVRNPVFPLEKTVANLNLEHLGRTDSDDGPQIGRLQVTGFDYSDLPAILQAAGKNSGVQFANHPTKSDSFFGRSDNFVFAQAGIPAHTVCAAFEFPDYHGVGDHWDKIDYDNLAKLNRAIAAGLWTLAGRAEAPQWNETNSKADRYRNARKSNGNKPAP